MGRRARVAACAALLMAVAAPGAQAFDPAVEAKNYSKTLERQATYTSPAGELLLRQVSQANGLAAVQAQAADPEREFATDLCWNGFDGCAGEFRLYDWKAKDYGVVEPVLFTARNGATLSGHVWATKAGPARRPGVVITNGSVQADEQMYWWAAQTLAKAGYVVLTFDPQGQGQSDTRGEAPDDGEGFPAQTDGRPFYDGTVDALDFFLSTAARPYEPRPSCTSGTSHAPKQDRRVKTGLDAGFNPFWQLLDPSRIGLAGHSYGASGVSYVGQADPRVKAVVAWDNLGSPDPAGREQPCPADPSQRAVARIAKPALGLSADYFLPPTPNTSDPDPAAKSEWSHKYSDAGVPTGELIIRGGTHYEFSYIPNNGFGATLRGIDLSAWYTTAWFDRYVKGDRSAERRLLTDRWRADGTTASIDPDHDGNLFSFYYPSRLDLGAGFRCEDLRADCDGRLTTDDGYGGEYGYLPIATSPDRETPACVRRITVRLPKRLGKVRRVRALAREKVVGRSTSRRVVVTLHRSARVTFRVTLRGGRHRTLKRTYLACSH